MTNLKATSYIIWTLTEVSFLSRSAEKLSVPEKIAMSLRKMTAGTGIRALLKTVDEFADKAENSRNLDWVANSNSLRRSAMEKRAALKGIDEQLDGKLQQL